jgi:hypothetical protein
LPLREIAWESGGELAVPNSEVRKASQIDVIAAGKVLKDLMATNRLFVVQSSSLWLTTLPVLVPRVNNWRSHGFQILYRAAKVRGKGLYPSF